jgi:DNA-binding CsgD family transcriptional regulator
MVTTANLQAKELISLLQQDEIPPPPQLRPDERRRNLRRIDDLWLYQVGSVARWVIERDGRAVFLIDRKASVIVNNSAARRLCEGDSWVQLASGKLNFEMPSVQTWLANALASKEARTSLPYGSAEARTLIRLQHVVLDGADTADSIDTGEDTGDLFMLTIGDAPPSVVTKADLRAAFGLTAAEASVASELYSGKSLALVAKELGLSVNTVKTHVKRVFRKCNVRSHVQLVKRIDSIT